jgi:serine/threonine protein kinase
MVEDTSLWKTSAMTAPGPVRWKSPELLSGENARETVQSDIYAFGMSCYEIYTGKVPFHAWVRDDQVLYAVVYLGKTPDRPSESGKVSDALWELWMTCWDRKPENRPSAQEIITSLL